MSSPSLLLAKRYLRFSGNHSRIVFMMRLCFLGIAIGTTALMLTLIIMNGFEKEIQEKMQGITAPIVLTAPNNKLDDKAIKTFIKTHFPSQVIAMSSSSLRQVLISTAQDQRILFLKGIEPHHEHQVSCIGTKIILPGPRTAGQSLGSLVYDNHILIGHKTAQQHHLSIGDEVVLLIPEAAGKRKIVLNKRKAIVSAIFNVGLEEYDNNLAYASLGFVKELFNEKTGVDQIALGLDYQAIDPAGPLTKLLKSLWPYAPDPEQHLIADLQRTLPGVSVHSWKTLYPALASSLTLEKYVMFFILMLIVIIASMNMISLLLMHIQQKRRDIAILRALGMPHYMIRRIFISMGLCITLIASFFGLCIAGIMGYILEHYPFICLPDVYYVSHLPARAEPALFIVVFCCTLLLGYLAPLFATRSMRFLSISSVLRQE